MVTGVSVSDTQTGMRAFSSKLLEFMVNIPGERYEYEMNVLVACAKEGISIIELPIQTIYHDKGNSCSHFRKVRDSIRIYGQLFKFSFVSFSSFLLDCGLFVLLTLLLPKVSAGMYFVSDQLGGSEEIDFSHREKVLSSDTEEKW